MEHKQRYELGQRAEEWVAARAEQRGWELLARRFRGRSGEIDLVARDGDCFVFLEVKSSARRPAYEALAARQQLRIRRAAQEWLMLNGPRRRDVPMRFDVVLVWGEPFSSHHVRDAF